MDRARQPVRRAAGPERLRRGYRISSIFAVSVNYPAVMRWGLALLAVLIATTIPTLILVGAATLRGLAWLLVEAGLDVWLAFRVVGVIAAAIGAFLAYRGLQQLRRVSVVPERTVETIRQDVEWAKDQTK